MKDSSHNSQKVQIERLPFRPVPGLASPHIQTVLPIFFSRGGEEPPSTLFQTQLDDGDVLYCKLSTPSTWKSDQKTIVMLHGLGGSDTSTYMVRMSRKFYQFGYRVLRVNLRGAGLDGHLAKRPYHGGTSDDVLQVIKELKKQTPHSSIILIGFSLGGNVTLKLLGELEEQASDWIETAISICAPIDLKQTMKLLYKTTNHLYHRYYVKGLIKSGSRWIGKHSIRSIQDFDNVVTAPQWGFRDAFDYYQQCSSTHLLSKIRLKCHLIFAGDDPFVDYRSAIQDSLSPNVKIWLSQYGGHMGFWGWAGKEHGCQWLDSMLLKLVVSK